MVDEGRGQGALSPSDREYLELGDERYGGKYTRQSAHKRRKAIPTRIRNALFDFRYLADPDKLGPELFEEVIARRDERGSDDIRAKLFIKGEPTSSAEIDDALADLVAFVFRAQQTMIETTVSEGVRRALDRSNSEAEVGEVQIPIKDPESIAERAERKMGVDRSLTDTEVRILLEQGKVDPAEVAEHVQEFGGRGEE